MVRLHLWILVELKLTIDMKKSLIILFAMIAVIFSAKIVFADYPAAYQDYLNKTGVYLSTYDNYLTARATYFASGSLDSQQKAMAATLKFLQTRDDVMTSYLTALKLKLQTSQGISANDLNSQSSQIDTQVSWYVSHNTRLSSAGSLSDLVSDSDEAKNEFNNLTQLTVYMSLITLGKGTNLYIRNELTSEISLVQTKLDEIKANQDKDVSSEERFLVDVQNKLDRSQAKDSDAANLINSVNPNSQQIYSAFQNAQSDLTDSNLYLKEANQGLLQIITQIKSAN